MTQNQILQGNIASRPKGEDRAAEKQQQEFEHRAGYQPDRWGKARSVADGLLPPYAPGGDQPAFLIHDRDAVYGKGFDARLAGIGVAGIRTPVRAPNANSVAERLVATLRRELLDL